MLGMIAGTHIEWIARSEKPHGVATPFTLEALEARVAADGALPASTSCIRTSTTTRDGSCGHGCKRPCNRYMRGPATARFTRRRKGALMEAAAHGVLVVRASRTPSGMTVEDSPSGRMRASCLQGRSTRRRPVCSRSSPLACGVDPALAFRTF